MNSLVRKALLIGLAAAAANSAQAALLLGNLANALDQTGSNIGATASLGVRFTTGSDWRYTINSVDLSVRTTVGASSIVPRVSFYSRNSSTGLPETLLGTANGSALAASFATTTGTSTISFTGLELRPGTSYWMVVDKLSGSGSLVWRRESASPGEVPTSTLGATPGAGGVGASSDIPDTVVAAHYYNFNINATQTVPEPQEYAMIAGLGLCAFAVWRRRQTAQAAV